MVWDPLGLSSPGRVKYLKLELIRCVPFIRLESTARGAQIGGINKRHAGIEHILPGVYVCMGIWPPVTKSESSETYESQHLGDAQKRSSIMLYQVQRMVLSCFESCSAGINSRCLDIRPGARILGAGVVSRDPVGITTLKPFTLEHFTVEEVITQKPCLKGSHTV